MPQCQCDNPSCEEQLDELTFEDVEDLNKQYQTTTQDAYVILPGHQCKEDEVVLAADTYLVVLTSKEVTNTDEG